MGCRGRRAQRGHLIMRVNFGVWEREAGGMDPGSGFEEERYANSRYTLETKLIGLEGRLYVGVAEEGEKKTITA